MSADVIQALRKSAFSSGVVNIRRLITLISSFQEWGRGVSPTPRLGCGRTRHARGLCARLTSRAAGFPPATPPSRARAPGGAVARPAGRAPLHGGGATPSVGRKAGMSPTCSQRARPGAARWAHPARAPRVPLVCARIRSPCLALVRWRAMRPAPPGGVAACSSAAAVFGSGSPRHTAPGWPPPALRSGGVGRPSWPMVAHRPHGLAQLRCACAPGGPLWSVALRDTSRRKFLCEHK